MLRVSVIGKDKATGLAMSVEQLLPLLGRDSCLDELTIV